MLISELMHSAEQTCRENMRDDHPVRLLLMDVLQLESYELYAQQSEEMPPDKVTAFQQQFNRYVHDNEPIQYILGYEYFAGRNLFVSSGALIPRPETEELVYETLLLMDEQFEAAEHLVVADVGTGSGAIAVSIAAEEPKVTMYATDISEEALQVARQNAASYAPAIHFLVGDMLEPLFEQQVKLDVLISNPPYIPEAEAVEAIVKDNEPHVALFGGADGLFFYRQILLRARALMKEQFLLAFEIGYDQASRLETLAQETFPDCKITIKKDMQQKDRMLFIQKTEGL